MKRGIIMLVFFACTIPAFISCAEHTIVAPARDFAPTQQAIGHERRQPGRPHPYNRELARLAPTTYYTCLRCAKQFTSRSYVLGKHRQIHERKNRDRLEQERKAHEQKNRSGSDHKQ